MRITAATGWLPKTLIKDLNPDKEITVEPIKGLPALKDLVSTWSVLRSLRSVMPFLVHQRPRADPGADPVAGRPGAL